MTNEEEFDEFEFMDLSMEEQAFMADELIRRAGIILRHLQRKSFCSASSPRPSICAWHSPRLSSQRRRACRWPSWGDPRQPDPGLWS